MQLANVKKMLLTCSEWKRERWEEGVGGRRRVELGPLRDNVALTMRGGDTQIASTFTRSRQHKCDYDYVTNVCVCM